MFSISTAWNASRHKDGYGIVKELRSLGFDSIELGFSLTEDIVKDIAAIAKRGDIRISSLHNMCPIPEAIASSRASPDYYSLASRDEDERRLAVDAAKNTVSWAKALGASAVILHAGRVEIKDRTKDLAALFGEDEKFDELKEFMIKEREAAKAPHVENVIKSLKEITPFALESGIRLALETRYYYREIPTLEEFRQIFDNFASDELFYWHDTGHAEVHQRLGFSRHKDFLDNFHSRLIGVHLHDIIGPRDDHKPPSYGTLDFSILIPYLTKDTLKVIEAHRPAGADQIRRSVKYLERIFGK
ncbi:MAG: sugar phosphate isomerase/epimerase [Candidatus Omnitrophica bacterium]|nr:sugar phosphate isomerase/epimerase [Candidatus Omnitrophota bacterium]